VKKRNSRPVTTLAGKARKAIAAIAAVAMEAGFVPDALIAYRGYQQPVVHDHTTKTAILHWSRQIGKSFTLAGWAINRLLKQLQTNDSWLVTVLSNSRDNGGEFVLKCHDVCRKMGQAFAEEGNREELTTRGDLPEDMKLDLMRFEIRLEIGGKLGRIIVLAANPRTARGFSSDLILDEFAFHQDSRSIWEAAEPIISANPEFLCRISSTGNGRRNMFYDLISAGEIPYYRVRRSDAHARGEIRIYSVVTGREITPEQARQEARDKRAYDQNYECKFNDENAALLTPDLINIAERVPIAFDEQAWSAVSIARMYRAEGDLYLGQDVGRNRDLSVQYVLEKVGRIKRAIGALRMEGMRLPLQKAQLEVVCRLPKFRAGEIDMTGLGLGLVEFAQDEPWGRNIRGVNFATTEPISDRMRAEGRRQETARVTEIMATALVEDFEARCIEIPADVQQRDDLLKPEKIVSPGGRVSIAATRDEAGHADHFWGLALANRATLSMAGPPALQSLGKRRSAGGRKIPRRRGVAAL